LAIGAIFGFSGSQNADQLSRIKNILSHRGEFYSTHYILNSCHMGYLGAESKSSDCNFGQLTQNDITINLSGKLFKPFNLSTIISSFKEEGPELFSKLIGYFVFALVDGKKIYLVRDPAGERTIYYSYSNNQLTFSVEPKGIHQVNNFQKKIRAAGVAQFLTYSFQPGSGTMLENIHEVLPGHFLFYDGETEPQLKRYYNFEQLEYQEDHEEISEDQWVKRFKATYGQNVADRIPGNEPFGVFLSGGLDSSIIAAELKNQGHQFKTYAIHFGKKYPNELYYAKLVADHLDIEHQEVQINPKNFIPKMRRAIWHLDDPIGDPITIPNYELAAVASKDYKYIFNGEGGDPLFGGPKNLSMLLHHWYGGIPRQKNFREINYLESYRRAYEELPFLLTPEWQKKINHEVDLESHLTPFFKGNQPNFFLNKLMAINIRLKGAHLILPKVERMLGANSITPLSPLFDSRLIDLSFQMPPHLKLNQGVEKYILKKAFEKDLPREIIDRPKSGMRVPVHFWFKGEMKRYAKKILNPKTIRNVGIFDEKRIKTLLKYEEGENRNRFGLRIWMILTFEIWRRLVIENEPI